MKFLIFFALAFSTVSPTDLYSRLIEDPVLQNEGRIVNGHKADPAQFKYQVGLESALQSAWFWCGASLIGEKWVLSAAHCVNGATSAKVFLGATKRDCPEKYYDVPERDILTHPLWDASNMKNDISLIQIPQTNESSRIAFVKIPHNDNRKYLGKSVVVSGWGRTIENVTNVVDDLHYAILKVSPGNICFDYWGLRFSDDTHICVATPDMVSTCYGDSGGPLVVEGKNLQIGVNSFGDTRGCTIKAPIIFTRVSAFRLWIFVRTGIKY